MRSVPQSLYDEDYYLHNCDGYTEDGSPCRRLSVLLSNLKSFPAPNKMAFDVGCGRGEVSKRLSADGYGVVAMDYSYAAGRLFEKNCGDSIPFIRHDVSQGMPWMRSECFGLVVLADIVEHLYSEQLEILGRETMRVAMSGAVILIDTPIMDGGESTMHVDIKSSAVEVHNFFQGTDLLGTNWYKKPEHCNIILRKR